MEVFVIFLAVLALSAASPGVNSVGNPSIFRKMIANCLASNDTVTCLSIEGITALNRAARMAKFEIFPGVSIHIRRDLTGSTRDAKAEVLEHGGSLFDLAMDFLVNFFNSHSLEVKFAEDSSQSFIRAIKEKDEVKKKKNSIMPALALALALTLKALILAKLALGLVLHIALQVLLSKKHGIK